MSCNFSFAPAPDGPALLEIQGQDSEGMQTSWRKNSQAPPGLKEGRKNTHGWKCASDPVTESLPQRPQAHRHLGRNLKPRKLRQLKLCNESWIATGARTYSGLQYPFVLPPQQAPHSQSSARTGVAPPGRVSKVDDGAMIKLRTMHAVLLANRGDAHQNLNNATDVPVSGRFIQRPPLRVTNCIAGALIK